MSSLLLPSIKTNQYKHIICKNRILRCLGGLENAISFFSVFREILGLIIWILHLGHKRQTPEEASETSKKKDSRLSNDPAPDFPAVDDENTNSL